MASYLCFLYLALALSLSVIHVNVDIKIKSKARIGFAVVVSYFLKSGWLCNLPPKRAVTWNAKFHPGLHEGVDVRADVRTIFSEPKFIECIIDNQIFSPMVLRCARESSAITSNLL